jgi:glycosyltransferase involved in cell wall biosynthesis
MLELRRKGWNMKILMLIDSIDIGGAETHLVDLSVRLKEKGQDVMVVSQGGIYEDTLKENSVPYKNLPVKDKNPLTMIKNIFSIRKIIKENDFQIVHAHGRLPSFLGGKACIGTDAKFMTTAHAKVENESFYKYITTYGDNVIAVSEDIKKYIISEFSVDENIIEVIPNGINTRRFEKRYGSKDLKEELGLTEEKIKILSISRMDDQLAQIALDLVDIVKKDDNLELLLVGDGNRMEELRERTRDLEDIHLLGKRTDIPDIMNLSDIVVAVSRSALEGFASEKLVLLAGGEGYLGVFNEDILDEAMVDNFTGRNSKNPYHKDKLKEDLYKCIDLKDTEEGNKIEKLGRKIVEDHYSLDNMIEKTLGNYRNFLGNKGEQNG